MSKEEPINKSLVSKLSVIQQNLSVPKSKLNKFGNYNYRSCEDILEAVKPLLGDILLTLEDDIISVGGRCYVKATAVLNDGKDVLGVSAFAREQEAKYNKEGKETMDHAQITGSASSYARKYALCGLFLLDDNKDVDSQDNTASNPIEKPKEEVKKPMGITDKATTKQIQMIQAMYSEKNLDVSAMKLLLKNKYNVVSHVEMTKKQASEWIDYVQGLEAKGREDINPDEIPTDWSMLN